MHSGTDVKPFTPSDHWLNDWPFDVWTVVQVRASITGATAERAVRTFQAALRPDPDADVAEGTEVHFWGRLYGGDVSVDWQNWMADRAQIVGSGRYQLCHRSD